MTTRRAQRNQVSSLLPKHTRECAKICTWILFTNMGMITMPVTEAECQQAMDAAPKAKMQCCEHSHPPVTGIYNIMNTNKLELKVELEGVVAHKVQSGLRSRMMKVGGYQVINLCLIS